jgi:hypothetical protein
MISYLDRPAERERDLNDVVHILENYVAPDDERRFAPEVVDAQVEFEHASAYLLGFDVREILNGAERELIDAFVARIRDEHTRQLRRRRWLASARLPGTMIPKSSWPGSTRLRGDVTAASPSRIPGHERLASAPLAACR